MTTARTLFSRALVAKLETRYDYAAEMLRRSLQLRLSDGDDEAAISSANQLVFVRGVVQDRYDEADGWAAVAQGLMARTDIGPIERGWLFNNVGASMSARGEPEAAIEPLRRAVAELTAGYGPAHHNVADPLI